MNPVKIKVYMLGSVKREYKDILEFYKSRIGKLSRFKAQHNAKPPSNAILLDPQGIEIESEAFYSLVKEHSAEGKELVFAVGPAEGFTNEMRTGKTLISLSKLTMRHELAYLVLLEQLYRALLRMKGTNYDK